MGSKASDNTELTGDGCRSFLLFLVVTSCTFVEGLNLQPAVVISFLTVAGALLRAAVPSFLPGLPFGGMLIV